MGVSHPPAMCYTCSLASLLSITVPAIMFGAGSPFMYVAVTAVLLATYWWDKALLLRTTRVPPLIKARLSSVVAHWLWTAAVLHSLFATWMVSSDEFLYPARLLEPYTSEGDNSAVVFGRSSDSALYRILTKHAAVLLALSLLLILCSIVAESAKATRAALQMVTCGAFRRLTSDDERIIQRRVIVEKTMGPQCPCARRHRRRRVAADDASPPPVPVDLDDDDEEKAGGAGAGAGNGQPKQAAMREPRVSDVARRIEHHIGQPVDDVPEQLEDFNGAWTSCTATWRSTGTRAVAARGVAFQYVRAPTGVSLFLRAQRTCLSRTLWPRTWSQACCRTTSSTTLCIGMRFRSRTRTSPSFASTVLPRSPRCAPSASRKLEVPTTAAQCRRDLNFNILNMYGAR